MRSDEAFKEAWIEVASVLITHGHYRYITGALTEDHYECAGCHEYLMGRTGDMQEALTIHQTEEVTNFLMDREQKLREEIAQSVIDTFAYSGLSKATAEGVAHLVRRETR